MDKVIGNIVGVPNPKSDWDQKDETKADYIKNKPTKLSQFEDDLTKPIIINFDENLKGDISYMKLSIVFAQGRDIVGKTVIDGDESFIYFDTITRNTNEIILTVSDLSLTRKWTCKRNGGWEYEELPLSGGNDAPFVITFDDAFSLTGDKDYKDIVDAVENNKRICVRFTFSAAIHEVGAIVVGQSVVGFEMCGYHRLYLECHDTNEWSYHSTPMASEKYVDGRIGNIGTALDSIIEIQNSLIGGDA